MAAVAILPGYAGKYTSESFTTTATGADTFDLSPCGQFSVQVITDSGTPTGTLQLQTRVGDTTWGNYGDPVDLDPANGYLTNEVLRFGITTGPFGLMRFTSVVTSGAVHCEVIGFPSGAAVSL